MNLGYLDKGSKVVPMLVRLHDSQKLYELARDKRPMAQEELSQAISELIGMETTERERELIADVLISVVRQAQKDLKMALSARLALMNNVPLRLVLFVANEEIDVAEPMLKASQDLGDLDLMYIVKSKPVDYWRAIAQRKKLSDTLIDTLTEGGDNLTITRLLQNSDIVLPSSSLERIARLAQGDENIAQPLLSRPEIDNDLAVLLYGYVGQELKKQISLQFEIPTDVMVGMIEDTVLEFQDIAISEFAPPRSMLIAAQRQHEKGLLGLNIILANLRRGQIQSFIAQFSALYNVHAKQVEHYLSQDKGRGVAVLCRAFDIQKADFVTMFLLTNRMREVGVMLDVTDMHRAVNYYSKLTQEMALTIMQGSE